MRNESRQRSECWQSTRTRAVALLESSSCNCDQRAASPDMSLAWQTRQQHLELGAERRWDHLSLQPCENHHNEGKRESWRDGRSRAFLANIISSAGSQKQPDQMRRALVSADCYGSLTYTRWKGSMSLKHSRRNKDKNGNKKEKKQAEIDGNIFLFGKRFVLRGASAPLGQLSHGNFWLHLFSSALDFYISWKKKNTLTFWNIANKHTFLLLQCIWLHFLGSFEHQQRCPTVPEAPKYKKRRQSHKIPNTEMWTQTYDDVMTYHSSMTSSDDLEKESTSEVGDSLLKSETDLLFNILNSIPSVCLLTCHKNKKMGGFPESQKLQTSSIL